MSYVLKFEVMPMASAERHLRDIHVQCLHPCAKLTHKIAAAAATAAATAAAAAKISARRRHGNKTIEIFTKTWKTKKLPNTSKKPMKIDKKKSILEELGINGRDHQILREKLPI